MYTPGCVCCVYVRVSDSDGRVGVIGPFVCSEYSSSVHKYVILVPADGRLWLLDRKEGRKEGIEGDGRTDGRTVAVGGWEDGWVGVRAFLAGH